ncbi:MAG: hypothetical protein O9272_15745 [Brevundimonas sp.]|jgi:cell wall-associated NlpC family hydrolase|nr:hypothetical protein [Brevundimonas sp.]
MTGIELARAAEALLGRPWRLHGRDPATGLDCIGVLGAALGPTARLPTGYPLRLRQLGAWLPDPAALGFAPAGDPVQPGDVVLIRVGPAQHHLAIAGHPDGWVHAHAGLRRVVHQADPPPGSWLGHWRLASQQD